MAALGYGGPQSRGAFNKFQDCSSQ